MGLEQGSFEPLRGTPAASEGRGEILLPKERHPVVRS
jgi:hypothetical protein